MSKIKVAWTRFGVEPGKVAGGAGTKRETASRLGDRCEFYLMTHEAIYDWYQEFGIEVKPLHLLKGRIGRFGSIPFLAYCIVKSIFSRVSEHFDIVASRNHDLWDLVPALCLKYRAKARLVVYIQSRLLPEWGSRSFPFWLIVWLERFLGLVLTKLLADAVVMNNRGDKPALERFGIPERKIYVVYPGIYAKEIKNVPSPPDKAYDCAHFGRLTQAKGIFDLLKAWRLVLERRSGSKLLIFGPSSPDELKRINDTIDRYDIQGSVTLLGIIPEEDKYRTLKQANVFVQPSYVEQWSIGLGEAIACGLPAVVYDIPTTRSIWGDTISYCQKGDINGLAEKILELLRDEKLANEKAKSAYDLVSGFTWERFGEEEFRALQSIMRLEKH